MSQWTAVGCVWGLVESRRPNRCWLNEWLQLRILEVSLVNNFLDIYIFSCRDLNCSTKGL